ncbi:MAG: PAS domain-containing protein [Alphaproteobacteria bacterium]
MNPVADDLQHAILRCAYTYWQQCGAGDGRPPRTRRLEPELLRPALGWLAVAEVCADTGAPAFRLFGSELAWRLSADLTNRPIEALPAPFGPFLGAIFRACVAARGPLLVHCAFSDPGADQISGLLLPWVDEHGAVVRVLAAVATRDRGMAGRIPPHSSLIRFRR